ncbi:MAG: DUF4230 domain-containing protein [Acidobacteria bacterium]|nr:DUF4230 domain-containing protein [Acidobacteriota bacterium]
MNRRYPRPRRPVREIPVRDINNRYPEYELAEKRPGGGGLWKLIAVISIGVAILASYAFMTGRGVYDIFAPQGRVVQTVNTTLLKMERENQLVTTRAFVQAVVRHRDEQWYGNAEVIRIVPATIHYAVNLAGIDREKLEYDDQSKTLWVPLPDVEILSIDPDLTKSETIRNLDAFRTEGLTGNILEESTEKKVRPTLEELGKSPQIINTAKDQAIVSVRRLLESALDAAGTGVSVKPYFKSEGKTPATDVK